MEQAKKYSRAEELIRYWAKRTTLSPTGRGPGEKLLQVGNSPDRHSLFPSYLLFQ